MEEEEKPKSLYSYLRNINHYIREWDGSIYNEEFKEGEAHDYEYGKLDKIKNYSYEILCPKCLSIVLITEIDFSQINQELKLKCSFCGTFRISLKENINLSLKKVKNGII